MTTAKAVGTFPWWRRIPIHSKLQASVVSFSILVLIVCAVSLTWTTNGYFHRKIRQDLTMLANVLADNLRAAVTFNDKQSAYNILAALKENSHITVAAIYKDRQLFTVYPEAANGMSFDSLRTGNSIWLQDDRYFASVPVRITDRSSGQLVLVSDLDEWKQIRAGLYYLFSGLCFALLLLTVLLSVLLKKYISEPLGALSAWAMGVSRDKNFNTRAEKLNEDEIGVLIDSLNTMLAELAKQKSIISWNEQLQKEIGERKRIEQELIEMRDRAEAAAHAKGRFLANMSHEIRTPMNAIVGFINVVLDGKLSPEQRKQLETVKRSARSLHGLLNDILDVAKLEQDKLELEVIAFSVSQVVDDVIGIFQVKADEKGVALVREIAADVPAALLGDPFRLNQVLSNLVGNAIKFTHSGRVQVILEKFNDQFLKFSVTDTGIGIPELKQENIFKSFGQADSSTSRQFGGTGLGTTISKQLVELMGGEIWFASREGVGSTFSFTFKINLADVKDLAQPDLRGLQHHAGLNTGKPLNILVAEDIVENAELLKVRLEPLGHKLVHAFNGKEALAYVERYDFDIILMDVHMPEVDGLAATKIIRASEKGRHIPILALTASVLREDQDNCIEAGMSGFVSKPIMFEELFSEIARVLLLDQFVPVNGGKNIKGLQELPDVPGINFEKAIRDWHDEKTYLHNLKRFFSMHVNDVASIRKDLESGDLHNVRQTLHALKGVAGVLSFETLIPELESLATAIAQSRHEQYDGVLDKISDVMAQARESVLRLSAEHDVTEDDGRESVDKSKLVESLNQFDRSLIGGQLDDRLLSELVENLKSYGIHQNFIDSFVGVLEDFEFDQARGLLREMTIQIR